MQTKQEKVRDLMMQVIEIVHLHWRAGITGDRDAYAAYDFAMDKLRNALYEALP